MGLARRFRRMRIVAISLILLCPVDVTAAPIVMEENYPILYKRYLQVKTVYFSLDDMPRYRLQRTCFLTMVCDLRNPPWSQLVFSGFTYTLASAQRAHRQAINIAIQAFAHLHLDMTLIQREPGVRMYVEPSILPHRMLATLVNRMPVIPHLQQAQQEAEERKN
jgi:hypothetical protein